MTSEPNPKKLKTNLSVPADATVTITDISSENLIPGAIIYENLFFIEKQAAKQYSVDSK